MVENKEISALFHLMDDPDDEVFSSITEKLVSIGKAVIPNLENLWENSADEMVQTRIEMIIHQLHFHDLEEEFVNWKESDQNLLDGALLVSKYCYPEMSASRTLQEVERMRRSIWLELNSYLTPLEQINVLSSILYNYFGLKGSEIAYDNPDEFLIYKAVENKRGNPLSNGILYILLCELLDIPVKAVSIPQQFIIGYFPANYGTVDSLKSENQKALFYLDPLNGQVYSHADVDNYFKRIQVNPLPSYFKPISHKKIIQHLLIEFAKCYEGVTNLYKKNDVLVLAALLDD